MRPEVSVPVTLDDALLRQPLQVDGIDVTGAPPEWATWLSDIGFVPGERVMLLHRAAMGGDPLVARIGLSTFALRRAEAACIQVSVPAGA
ncbi:FeoA family protein [Caenimonas koreensis]|uniref:Ferrous iron transport protein A n=1 Tax=Caenimonas koreensis DSM 17982 TaxID=1121255 RepID=A0A844B2W6_9BURK|nr:FeoA family protein [Caenimonas koreensis]MRD49098.1 ferrous iron transport protein A [Caenimonas koreensis DSM 17982]